MSASSGSSSSLSAMEYQSLYTEIADTSRRIEGVLQICVIGFTSVMTFIFSVNETETTLPRMALPGLFLLPSFIILMCLALIRSSFVTIVRTGTYILVFYERHDQSISWQHRIQQIRENYVGSRALANSMLYIFLPLFLSSLFFSLLTLLSDWEAPAFWERNIAAIFGYAAAYVVLYWRFYVLMEDMLYVWGTPYFTKMINRWIKLQKAETNEVLKKRLAEKPMISFAPWPRRRW